MLKLFNMGFEDRANLSSTYEDKLFESIYSQGFMFAKNGTEHTHPDFVGELHYSSDQTSKAIRFQPDGVACIGNIPRTFYVEAKRSVTLEKDAYEQYTKLHSVGNIVVIFFAKYESAWSFIEDIQFEPAEQTVNRYNNNLPIIDGWISPRELPIDEYRKWKKKFPLASGTPYKKVDRVCLRKYDDFKYEMINRLSNQ